ncbi:hypothetical protein HanXRQr2_Chr16g0757461 [Helianthus annuus]|uniref:Uncharacterized protein n=1 Tax=Helianthus annuus TaxID=4232 RepID=A0A251T9R1_HELAN|nr:hypothetical protein HanXRQr2_Chr16g0757461 [Helianthus annuus]KAJ0438757.1 hypothetical protein HanHA300_Chr16g0617711 [Helianthus annuus]KAJ0461109.1 hypothetical protein HanHA89_Chr16g0668601 [Helianthus annuus]KAJ0641532.1 hypothetical protein HanLR1_Chr16g0628301 [Helianthus annuus]KAJ0645425.1 hypothetical protein HanOQP8_Chr16g0623771 [Helianthus annuus]
MQTITTTPPLSPATTATSYKHDHNHLLQTTLHSPHPTTTTLHRPHLTSCYHHPAATTQPPALATLCRRCLLFSYKLNRRLTNHIFIIIIFCFQIVLDSSQIFHLGFRLKIPEV